MARKPQVPEDGDSQKENAPDVPKLNNGKLNRENARKARVVRDEEDDVTEQDAQQSEENDGGEDVPEDNQPDEQEDEEGMEEEGSPKGHKRARINADGDSISIKNDVDVKGRGRVTTLPRDDDGFIPGSIVRIQLKNFVTYDWVEFRPGPYLNLIFGPNGTGKSSIACAICLGLNWSPTILGRASELGNFVKIGAETGHIEIELKGPKGKPNLIIRRNLRAKSKSSTFTLNGVSAPGKEISGRMAELNVQVGNLCSFLPQDKVSEFAAMTPQQLLRETQRAAGDENLTNWHDTLISSGKELKALEEQLTEQRAQLKTMQERNAILERDVERYNERRAIEHQIELLQVLIPVQRYREIRAQFLEKKAEQRALHVKVGRLREKNAPLHAKLKEFTDMYNAYGDTRDDKKKETKKKFDRMRTKYNQNEKLDQEAEELSLKLEGLKKNEKGRARRIKTLETEIAKMENELENPPQIESMDAVTDDQKQLNLEHHDVIRRQEDLQDRQRVNVNEVSKHTVEIEARLRELKDLDDANARRLHLLGNWDKDCHDAVMWLRKDCNRKKFKMEVFEPPIISLTVPDGKFTNAVEACFTVNQLKTFVTQCPEDYKTLNQCINDQHELGRSARINTWFRTKTETSLAGPPMTREEMAALGFDGYAIDYVQCPDGLLWYLKAELHFHRTAIGLDARKVDVDKAMQAVSRVGPNGEGGNANFVAENTIHSVSRSKYGKRLAQNMTREVRPARNLVNAALDPSVKVTIDGRIAKARSALNVLEEEGAKLGEEEKVIREEENAYQKRAAAIEERKKAIRDADKRRGTLKGRLTRQREKLGEENKAPSVAEERAKLKKQLLEMTKKRVKIAKEHLGLICGAIQDQTEAARVGLMLLQANANKVALEKVSRVKDTAYNSALVEFTEADNAYKALKEESKKYLERSRDVVFGLSDELRDEYQEISLRRKEYDRACEEAQQNDTAPPPTEDVDLRTLDQLTEELDTQQTNLAMNLNTNPGVIEQYEKRAKDIEDITATIESRENKCKRIERGIKISRDKWQPALENLVKSIGQKFSAAFDRIGCAGEVQISEHQDYDKWAIDILVKFRNDEKLQLLTAQRQSGGERALTTILYLMSLTEEARAPFSLVDEINQGMDGTAERVVHNSMVDVTCKPDSGQYFLITPKLLPDLKYHERMKVLCVNNGEWLPEENDIGNLMKMIDAVARRRDRSGAAP